MIEQSLMPEILGRAIRLRSHHVPTASPTTDVIERSEHSGDVERLGKGGGDGPHQTDIGGGCGKRAKQGQRLQPAGLALLMRIWADEAISQEEHIEKPCFNLSGDTDRPGEIFRMPLCLRTTPCRGMPSDRLVKISETDFPGWLVLGAGIHGNDPYDRES